MTFETHIKKTYDSLSGARKDALEKAFRRYTFLYGTRGIGSAAVEAMVKWVSLTRNGKNSKGEIRFKKIPDFKFIDPGVRVASYLEDDERFQMMDMYYGMAGNDLHTKRDDDIGAFIHECMGFNQAMPYNSAKSGRQAYQACFGTDLEGYAESAPKSATWGGQSATRAISEVVRWCVKNLRGSIIFEGYGVAYNQVFLTEPTTTTDTDVEARDIFSYFKKGMSEVPFGPTGTVTFHYNCIETVPTHLHFLANWNWAKDKLNKPENQISPINALQSLIKHNKFRTELMRRQAYSILSQGRHIL